MNTLLLIDDDAKFCEGFSKLAKRIADIEVTSVGGLADAEMALISQTFDVIALDLTLDDATPSGSIAAIHHLSKKAPVVIITGQTGERAGLLRNMAIFNGAAGFIQKDHLDLGGAWPMAMGVLVDAHLRSRRGHLTAEAA